MSQSLTRLYAHLVFSTKNRRAWLDEKIRNRVHGYLATTIRDLDSAWVIVGGVADHVHILFELAKSVAPVRLVENVKRESSKFVKKLGDPYKKFCWQRGYGLFSVSPKDRDAAEHYVRHQEEHHRKQTFQDEYRKLLNSYNIEFFEQYIWD